MGASLIDAGRAARNFSAAAASYDRAATLQQRTRETLLADLFARVENPQRLLDLGCGTGLVGQALPDQGFELVGVDLAAGMLDRARQRQRYQRLEQADLVGMMAGEPEGSYDIVTSADVFIYVGKIDDGVRQVRRVLKPGGLFLFSVESFAPGPEWPEQDYRLETSGRYAHAAAYLDRLAAHHGFERISRSEVDIRVEQGKPIQGWLDVWRAPA